MEEVAPGVFEVDGLEIQNLEATGTERIVDYKSINMPTDVRGPMLMVKEISSHAEFSARSIGIGIVDTVTDSLDKLFWYQGKHFFPKEHLELAVDNKDIVIVFTNHGNKSLSIAQNFINYILPISTVTYNVLDMMWVEGNMAGSLMCKGKHCCDPGGIDVTKI